MKVEGYLKLEVMHNSNIFVPTKIQGNFFNWASPENVSTLPPPHKSLDWPPLQFEKVLSMAAEKEEILNT